METHSPILNGNGIHNLAYPNRFQLHREGCRVVGINTDEIV